LGRDTNDLFIYGENIMTESEDIDLSKYEWQDTKTRTLYQKFQEWVQRIAEFRYLYPPFAYIFITKPKFETYLVDIAKNIGIDDETSRASLQNHWKRLSQYNVRIQLIILLISFSILGMLTYLAGIYGSFWLDVEDRLLGRNPDTAILVNFLSIILILALLNGLALFTTANRVAISIVSRRYSDTVTLAATLSSLIDMLRVDALGTFSNRRNLQSKLNFLSRRILMLAYQYKSESLEDQQWIYSHFKGMERYIRDHEHLIVAPKADSLEILRRDFYHLLKILISGEYGEFKYEYAQPPDASAQTTAGKVGKAISGFVGIVLPTLLLYLILFTDQQERIARIGLDTKTVALISLAWFLLTLDATLKLGIVDRITGLAKSIRDLG